LAGIVGCSALFAGVLVSLELHALESNAIVRRHEAKSQRELDLLKADVRGAMHRLGYNAVILPSDQSLGDWYADDYAVKTMPESHARRLDDTCHLIDRYLPRLRSKIKWLEEKWTVIVVGVGEEVFLDTSVGPAIPLVDPIRNGCCVVGFELHQALELRPNDTITVLGRDFVVQSCAAETGTKDDITLTLQLADAQRLLDQSDSINEILVVEHLDVWGRREEIRRRVCEVLPDCQVVERASETMSRAHARVKVAEEARAAAAQELQRRAALETERKRVMWVFLPAGMLVTAFWVALLMYLNVRERSEEIGVLMALGLRFCVIQILFFSKAMLLGLIGGILGFLCGSAVVLLGHGAGNASWSTAIFSTSALPFAVVLSVGACLLGTWLPARLAARLDVALVLREE
jgi:putative ABC transport system permease protein